MTVDQSSQSLWKNKAYVSLIASQTVSALGDWLDILAVLTLVAVKWNASPMAVSLMMLCYAGPMILLGPIAGSIADKYDRKKIMIISDLVCAVLVVGVAFSTTLWQVYLLIFLKSCFVALFMPAKNGKLKEIVPNDQMQKAMGISSIIDNGAKIVGPTLSGILVASVGIQWAFYLDAISFLVSAIFLYGVPKTVKVLKDIDNEIQTKESFISSIKEGYIFLKTIPSLLLSLFLFSLTMFVLQMADTQLMVLFREMFIDPTQVTGFTMAASGLGMIVCSILITKVKLPSVIVTTSVGGVGVGVSFALIAMMAPIDESLLLWFVPVLGFIAGSSFGLASIPFQISVQTQTPVSKTGRVFGTIGSLTTLATIIGMTLGGVLSELIGVVFTFIISGCSLLLLGCITIVYKKRIEGRDRHVSESDRGIQRGT
jgi:MFS family permease